MEFINECIDNNMRLNTTKCKVMQLKCNSETSVVIDGIQLEHVESYKYLGVIINKQLNWD